MKTWISLALALCMLLSCGLGAVAEGMVFSFTITEYTGETEDPADTNIFDKDGLLNNETIENVDPTAFVLSSQASNYHAGVWSNQEPTFTLTLKDADGEEITPPDGYTYAIAKTTDKATEIYTLTDGQFIPLENGEYKLQFLLLNGAGQRVSVEKKLYDLKLDFAAPSLLVEVKNSASMTVHVGDTHSGIAKVTIDGTDYSGSALKDNGDGTWQIAVTASKSVTYKAGAITVTDNAGNVTATNAAVSLYVLNASPAAGAMNNGMNASGFGGGGISFSGGGRGGSSRTVYHSKSTVKSVVAYNAVELKVQQESMAQLQVGGETLDLELYHSPFLVTEETDWERGTFTAEFASWNGDDSGKVDTLVLKADDSAEESSTWYFSGKMYKKLAASDIDYLVLQRGSQVTALSTAGFTAGIRYSMYRAAGLASGEFDYAVTMNDQGGFEMYVTVDGQRYPVSADTTSEFYYYDVFSGTMDQLSISKG